MGYKTQKASMELTKEASDSGYVTCWIINRLGGFNTGRKMGTGSWIGKGRCRNAKRPPPPK